MEYQSLEYNFDNLLSAITMLTTECEVTRKEALKNIKNELNLFFKDFMCTEAIFTMNTDNDFFGIQISPMFTSIEDLPKIFNMDLNMKFHHYLIEFDSRLFNGDFTAYQILALMIHDINKLNNPNLIKDIVGCIDYIAISRGEEIHMESIYNNLEFFLFAIQDTARKMTSAFEYIPVSLGLADDFIRSYNLNQYYEDGMFSIKKCRNNLKDQVCCPTITLHWFMSKYKYLNEWMHKDIVQDLKDSIKLSGSKLVKRLIDQVIEKMLVFRTDEERMYYKALTESAKKRQSLASQIKYSGMKSLEDDVYEYRMRIKNVETENEAIYIIRQINNRMGIISDYLETEELSDLDRERFFKLYDKYDGLREELSKKAIYSRKMYGLFVDYNALQQMSNGSMTMNTY